MKYLSLLLVLFPTIFYAQNKALTHEDLVTWKRIRTTQITDDGQHLIYTVKPEEGDGELNIYNVESQRRYTFPRGEKAKISHDNRFVVFMIKPLRDSVRAMKLRKVKKDKLPKDTLAIYNLETRDIVKVPDVQNFKMPEKWSGWLTYLREPEKKKKKEEAQEDSGVGLVTPEPEKEEPKKKKESKENGAKLTLRNLDTGTEEFLRYVTDYKLSKEGERMIYYTTSDDTTYLPGVYIFDFAEGKNYEVHTDTTYGTYKKMTLSKDGQYAAFVAEGESEDPRLHPFDLFVWKDDITEKIDHRGYGEQSFLPDNWRISEHHKLTFSEDNGMLLFGIAPELPLKDTTILEEEKPVVEIWTSRDKRLYTQQNVEVEDDKKKTYTAAFYPDKDMVRVLSDESMPELRMNHDKTAAFALGYDESPYQRQMSWEGFPVRKDVYVVSTNSGERTKIAENLKASPRLSPEGTVVTWYNLADSTWNAYHIPSKMTKVLTDNNLGRFQDELNDRPMDAYDYGTPGWMKGDKFFYLYDRYDIWRVSPSGKSQAERLTKGREEKMRYRYIRLDREKHAFGENEVVLLQVFDEKSKGSGYATLNVSTGEVKDLIFDENLSYGRSVKKAKNADCYVFTRENFQTFPNLHVTDGKFKKTQQVTDINPQQKEYAWGSAEKYTWTAYDGQQIEGLLIKPADFDPKKQYPMIVNFYERSSDRLHRHRAPFPHRSTINYSFYASKGYIIFNPDVPYKIGYPGESAYNSVVSGVEALIAEGFIDKDRIGAQGHSWGGYQVAHLATKTDIFACIESGAPVVNMFSAYGGIRWRSGLSRMFQYEHTQSRIGGTIWNSYDLYKENSPIFNTDKINTPILILHNDKDGAVPWYQGIEWFVALRRLDKPAWMLNYNDEPHWPVKLPNRKDFNVKMQEFFDHYLMGAEMPVWMKEGNPPSLQP